ncbi:P-loop containing nucleoside triphosphate hydrolase protein [Neolentinus lepideus HHB14362 ss-1]|uniref:p-loop containing nucleoside triphosphate hydrolase protein n=1 Tax=Neolentinus lepideus HHB14362 ss-1 TaxID=1314782 RepID=A0A165S592_9AGAM|nr:P-loop containing nucleoside triphosphate hydrolase protein [Neolentinus lepideus HHB14362 ss-1]
MHKGRRSRRPAGKGTFNPDDTTKVKHSKLGVWELYEEISNSQTFVPVPSKFKEYREYADGLPYIWRMLKDILILQDCHLLLVLYAAVTALSALVPAVSLWFSAQLLTIVQVAVDTRTVDKRFLFRIAGGRIACVLAVRVLAHLQQIIATPLQTRVKRFYSLHIFHALARLDLPTYEDTSVQRQIEASYSRSGYGPAWDAVKTVATLGSTVMQIVSQLTVLVAVLREQPEGPLLTSIAVVQTTIEYLSLRRYIVPPTIWAATTKNSDYVRMEGLKRLVNNNEHRKEIVAGNLGEYLTEQYRRLSRKVGDYAMDFWETKRLYETRDSLKLTTFLHAIVSELPLIAFSLRAVQYPASIPISLASLNLLRETVQGFTYTLLNLLDQTDSFGAQISDIKKLYEIENIPNQVADGTEPFVAEDDKVPDTGISVEFRNVSFKYPSSDKFALRDVSFTIRPGQLCVIVGSNGSGKSTILKLIARLYDPTEGSIFVDGRDIRTLRLADLRQRISVLFQDYTHFPLSIKDNIALGNPEFANDDRIMEAARLGGAVDIIKELPEGMDTYLNRPVRDYYAAMPEGTKTLFGRNVDYARVRGAGGMKAQNTTSLSGGQMQRLAVSRTFMRSIVSKSSEAGVGLLLFDEPSASLDPAAEHDLFERLRQLRGQKTMLFSSHRFGNLTRHADLLLYINNSVVEESGTHEELLKKDGQYAHIWRLQAQAFLS